LAQDFWLKQGSRADSLMQSLKLYTKRNSSSSMGTKIFAVSALLLMQLAAGAAVSLASASVEVDAMSVADMGKVFGRSEVAHQHSMIEISNGLSAQKAMELLQGKHHHKKAMEQIAAVMSGSTLTKTALRMGKQPSGYSGIDGARKVLNEMIFEALQKYDTEIAKCTDFYSKQCALMEIARGDIAAANYVAANSRALILDAQGNINKCEVAIPETKQELDQHNTKCRNEVTQLKKSLKLVMGDIAVMTMILKMTDCESKLLQMDKFVMLKCKDECTKKSFVSFNHKELQEKVRQLASPESQALLHNNFADMFDIAAPLQQVQLVQVGNSAYQEPLVNKTQFNNPPVPRTEVPLNPCNDPDAGAPSAADKRAAKCTIKKSPECFKLQSRFLAIQGGIADERDKLLEDISNLESSCLETKTTLETTISNDESLLRSSQTKLAMATEKESSAGEEARQTAKQNEQYNDDLVKQMKTCSTNYIGFETELCALKKIRGEVYKMKGGGHSAFFQDCEVSQWEPEECTKVCAGGEQKLSRNVLTHPNGGAKCLPLEAEKSCNSGPCPVNCKLDAWSGWSKCSAKCGGGVTQRLRDVVMAMKHGGKPCGEVSEAKACNAAACEKDCELGEWTMWTACSKHCDGGTNKRSKFVRVEAEGSGKCAGKWSKDRLEYKQCNMHRCEIQPGRLALGCNKTMDVVMLIDQCPKSGKEAFAAQIKAAKLLVDSFAGPGLTGVPNFAVIQYCGPRTWSGVSKCTGKSKKKVDIEATCKTKIVSHFTEDMEKVKGILNGLQFAKGTKLVSLALLTAKSELTLGRKSADSVVVAFINGQPLSFRKTGIAAKSLRTKARLLWVVTNKFSPLKDIKTWATRRWEENVVRTDNFEGLANPDTVTHIIANICPKKEPVLLFDWDHMENSDMPMPDLMLAQKHH